MYHELGFLKTRPLLHSLVMEDDSIEYEAKERQRTYYEPLERERKEKEK